jgi:hypothetical protein
MEARRTTPRRVKPIFSSRSAKWSLLPTNGECPRRSRRKETKKVS